MLWFENLTTLSPVDGQLHDRVALSLRHRMALLRAASDAAVRQAHGPEPRRWAATWLNMRHPFTEHESLRDASGAESALQSQREAGPPLFEGSRLAAGPFSSR